MLKLLLKLQGDAVSHSQCPHNTLFLLPFKVNIVKGELKSNNKCPPSPCIDNVEYLHLTQLVPKLCIKCIEACQLSSLGWTTELEKQHESEADYREVAKFGLSKQFPFSKSPCGSAHCSGSREPQPTQVVPRLCRHQELDAQVTLIGGKEHTNTSLQPKCC